MIEFLPNEQVGSIENYPNYLAVFWDDTDIQFDDVKTICYEKFVWACPRNLTGLVIKS